MVQSAVLGFPRIGPNRELKKATEGYWNGKITVDELFKVGKDLRTQNWKLQKEAVLDLSLLFNVIPDRYTKYDLSPIDTLFAMGRGLQRKATETEKAVDVTALEMVKWFDSNYHYVRPTFSKTTQFKLNGQKPVDEFLEAKELGIHTRPVLLGPVSYLFLGKADKDSLDLEPLSLLEQLLPLYTEILSKLASAGATEVQIDEPVLQSTKDYFGYLLRTVVPNLDAIKGLPVAALHVDFVRAPEQFDEVVAAIGNKQTLSVGIVDGRNIWKNDFKKSSAIVNKAIEKLGADRVVVATSSSLLHTPVDLNNETKLDAEIKGFFSFATQKLDEVVVITKNVSGQDVAAALEANAKSVESRGKSKFIHDAAVKARVASIDEKMSTRAAPFEQRLPEQQKVFNLPLFPTTTIGSFPQTKDIRINRNKFNKGTISAEEYEKFINSEIEKVIRFQEEIGLDV
ncbi:CFC_collapsed_G0057570.mRNA.1.CDS.1 [Saccharomyces cerevisiae]|nr:CFC_collapsed_G0057570.mRNA.1.CDS.1 [Saccharomyces cerevisiae]